MAFEDVVFPDYPMKHGISKLIIDPVSVITNGTLEYRIKKQAWQKFKWTVPVQTMTNEQKEDIRSFLLQRSSSLNSFKYVDPDAAVWNNARLSYHSGTLWEVNMPLSTFDQSVAGTHPLFNAEIAGVSLNGTPIGSPLPALQITDGVPVIDVSGSISADDVRITSGFMYFTVRLASTLSYALVALDTNNYTLGVQHDAIELLEVHGEY